jgi:hypothetical protein
MSLFYFLYLIRYDSWVRSLSFEAQKNICPLTKKPLTKRELVILTKDNIDQYRFVIFILLLLLFFLFLFLEIINNYFTDRK